MTKPTTDLTVRRFTPSQAPSGPPVLLLHGFASSGKRDWLDGTASSPGQAGSDGGQPGWVDALTAAGRVVVVPDLPGHGTSPAPRTLQEATTSGMVRALSRVIEAEGAPVVDVVAYSLGARLAWELPRSAPARVAHLVLGGISPGEPFATVNVEEALAFATDGTPPGDPLTGMIAQMIAAPGQDARALATCIEGLRSEPFTPGAGDVDVPVLFVAGADDPVSDGIEKLVELVPGSVLRRVTGGHMAALHGDEFRSTTLTFLSE
ncbi:alpha/beta fold hydrolase [Actinobacteria bacterium YIM 96077]|uniref:Hydrolase n=1 Tax=Phytoactinopolyspora halophila TaxID=1981511 RepID=A0A329QJR8_9ACTN|nr:alpha/beta fold hydrolase [Phytoactinopolyspora halophila]AYY12522.1 alpha/beta fold hydrolase [Actinobacteria bacterium YIM 96077]RAW12574.1 hydrolase [Phytoactinopolyspora halophila]